MSSVKRQLRSQAGFSLVETVAAMGILALAAIPLLQVTTDASRNAASLETRLLARTVAENVMARSMSTREVLDAGLATGQETQLGRTFIWTRTTGPAQQDLARQAADGYQKILSKRPEYYPAINAATMALFAGDAERARALARTAIALAKREDWTAKDHIYYAPATVAEALLLLGEAADAQAMLKTAADAAPATAWPTM